MAGVWVNPSVAGLSLSPTIAELLLGELVVGVALARLDEIAVGFTGDGGPEEGTGLGAGKVNRNKLFFGLHREDLDLLILVDVDGSVGVALGDLGEELRLEALVFTVVVLVIRDEGRFRDVVGLLLLLGLLLALEQSGDRLQDLLELVHWRRLHQLLVVVLVFVDAVVAVGNVVSVGMHLH